MTKVAIEIEKSTLKSLQGVARPLVDTYDTVIARLLGHYQQQNTANNTLDEAPSANNFEKPLQYASDDPPNLTHTRLIRAYIDGKAVPRAKWNSVLHVLYEMAAHENDDENYLCSLSTACVISGIKTDNGYKPVAGGVISLQGVSAKNAWPNIADIACKLGKSVSVEFEWRNKKAAAHPGKSGILSWPDTRQNSYLQSIAASLNEWKDDDDARAFDNL